MSVNRSAIYVGLMVIAAAVAGYMVSRMLARTTAPTLQSGSTLPVPRPVAAFMLEDHLGEAFGNARLAGHPALVFFGFTHCPDICPTTLAMVAQLKRDSRLADLQVLFITVDPGRDTRELLRQYVGTFGRDLVGLRGADDALEPLLRNLNAARSVHPGVGTDYSVDHSANLFYINAQGAFSAVFTPPFGQAALLDDLVALMSAGW